MAMQRINHSIDEYAKSKNWYWYLPAWFFALYLFIKLLEFHLGEPSPSFFISIAHSFNFMLHEMAHLITAFLPSIFVAAAGSFSEILLGSLLVFGAFKTKSYFASVFCFLWLMLSFLATADYMADATRLQLELVSFGGGDAIHDWRFIFTELGILGSSGTVAGATRAIGIASGLTGLAVSGWVLIKIASSKAARKRQEAFNTTMNQIASKRPADREDENFIGGNLYPTAHKGNLADHDKPENKPDNSNH